MAGETPFASVCVASVGINLSNHLLLPMRHGPVRTSASLRLQRERLLSLLVAQKIEQPRCAVVSKPVLRRSAWRESRRTRLLSPLPTQWT